MVTAERVLLYVALGAVLVLGAMFYFQNRDLNLAQQDLLLLQTQQMLVQEKVKAQEVVAGDPLNLHNELANSIPFEVTEDSAFEGGPLEDVYCSGYNSAFSLGAEYTLYRAADKTLYVQADWSERDFTRDLNNVRSLLTKYGYQQCIPESEIIYPWPQISYMKDGKAAVILASMPRGAEGYIELYLEK